MKQPVISSGFRFRTLTFLLALPALLAGSGVARAAEVTKFKLKDHSLIANFEAASDDGCFVAQTLVRFSESITKQDGTVIIGPPTTMVDVEYANACTGEFLSLTGGTTTQTFSIAGDLSAASLSATVTVTDGTNSANVSLCVSWTANGDVQVAKGHFKSTDGNTTTVDKFDDQVRPADVGGSITTTLPLAAGPTPLQLAQFQEGGTIGKDVNGERTVTKKH